MSPVSLGPGPPLTLWPWLSGPGPFTFIVVVLHREDPALGSTGTVKNEFPVQGLDGERVQHANVDFLFLQQVSSSQGLVQGHPSSNHSHLVILALQDHLVVTWGQ